ncbi:hypothetical protein HYS95_01575 [Candidatus Daviesbacteria bacterium]|nr:hypothetical protein [Candidatus Daviesbacteria bacterium]
MNTQDLLNILLAAGLLTFIACLLVVTYFLVKTLKAVTELSRSLSNTAEGLRDNIKMRVLTALPALVVSLISKLIRRGR